MKYYGLWMLGNRRRNALRAGFLRISGLRLVTQDVFDAGAAVGCFLIFLQVFLFALMLFPLRLFVV